MGEPLHRALREIQTVLMASNSRFVSVTEPESSVGSYRVGWRVPAESHP